MVRLATWNVNSLTVRLEQVLSWIQTNNIDILALQETKLIDEKFPITIFTELGLQVIHAGQKSYNGVAIISRLPITEINPVIPNCSDPQKRFIAASIAGIRLINLYVPNGSEIDSEKYHYKLSWLQKITTYIADQLKIYPKLAVVGDFNIAPEDRDVHDPILWQGHVLVSAAERAAYNNLLNLGLKDGFRLLNKNQTEFTWWDYRGAAFRKNHGLRIDHILLTESLTSLCTNITIDRWTRQQPQPSDHAPIMVELRST